MDSMLDFAQLALNNIWTFGVSFLAVLGILVFVHEWGHYIVARLCGVRVETFSIGFGKEIFGWTAKSGTRWKICLVPLGGYVKMFGDSDPASAGHTDQVEDGQGEQRPMTESERSEAFFAKPIWKRSLIVFSGPGINFLFAIVVLAILYGTSGRPVTPPLVSAVEVESGADKAHFQPHDVIKMIGDRQIDSFDEVKRTVMLTLEEPLTFQIERDGQPMTIVATPQRLTDYDRFGFAHERGYMGLIGPANGIDIAGILAVNGIDTKDNVEKAHQLVKENLGKDMTVTLTMGDRDVSLMVRPPVDLNAALNDPKSEGYNALILGDRPGDEIIQYGPFKAVQVAIGETWRISVETLKAVGQMITGTRSAKELGGIIRIGAFAGDMAERGFVSLAVFTALLSINLGLINLFPIPMLDGGHLVFYGVEAVRGKPLSEKAQEFAFRCGLVVLVTLMVFSNLNDVFQLLVSPAGKS